MLEALDAWNLQSFKSNDVDSIQDVVLFSGNYSNGRITLQVDIELNLSDSKFILSVNIIVLPRRYHHQAQTKILI